MAKLQIKSGIINPFGGLFSIFRQFDRSGFRSVIDMHLLSAELRFKQKKSHLLLRFT